jgi:transcription termination/antitermination protein NusA
VRMVVSELRGEKIDIIPFNEEPARFVAKALSPARVREVLVDDDSKQATVVVPDDQLSLAIGKEGQNARLAARLTGWRVDIRSETEFAEEESEMGYAEEDVSGRCACILANGKRCPNASLPGSRYCGLPAHQALEGTGTDYLVPPEDDGGDAEEPAASSDNGDLPIEDLVEEAPLEDAVAEAPVDDEPAATATADQPTDEEPATDADPVPEDEPAEPEAEVSTEADEELDSDAVAAADLPSEPIDDETETPDVSAADEEEPEQEAQES